MPKTIKTEKNKNQEAAAVSAAAHAKDQGAKENSPYAGVDDPTI